MLHRLAIFFLLAVSPLLADRGSLLSYSKISRLSQSDVDALMRQQSMETLPKSASGVELFKLSYETIDPHGKPCKATGVVVIPMGVKKAPPMVSFSHGTIASRYDVPSELSFQIMTAIAAFSSGGYVVIASDYLGLGGSDLIYHPYCHAASLASCNLDMLKAAKALCKKIGQPISNDLFITGYSEGGMAAMALHRELEQHPVAGFNLKAAAPMAGPYDLATATLGSNVGMPSPRACTYVAYILLAYNFVYNDLITSFNAAFVNPYSVLIPTLFDGTHSMFEIEKALPADPKMMLQPELLKRVLQNPKDPIVERLQQNETFQWVPKVPTALVGIKGDKDVPFINTETAYAWMKAKGGNVVLMNMGDDLDHFTGKTICHMAVRQFFDARKK